MKVPHFLLYLVFLFLTSTLCVASEADSSNYYRTELKDLLKLRKEKFEAYSLSLEQRSGIFGNKTKGDIKQSNRVLIDIVRSDNHIIQVLNRVLDFRTYEKVNMNYDLNENARQVNNLMQASDTLSKQVITLKKEKEKLEKENSKLSILVYALLAFVVLFVTYRLKIYFSKAV